MNEVSVIGIDLAKRVFQLAALDSAGGVVWTKRLKRAAFMRFMEQRAPRCLIGLEACGSAHYWARWLERRGFTVKPMAPRAVKGYRVGSHKNDLRDALAAGEAAARRSVRTVRVKSEAAQAVQAAVRLRERRVRQLVQSSNQLRGLLYEFGFVLPKRGPRLLAALAELRRDGELAALPTPMPQLVETLCQEIVEQRDRLAEATAMLGAAVAAEAACQRLQTIPHIGPINAATLLVALERPQAFASGRAFAAHLGLVPRQHASAEKSTLIGIPQQRANSTRSYLVLAAQSLLVRVARMNEPPGDPLLAWAARLLRRKHRNVVAVALANKLARIAWAVMRDEQPYRAGRPANTAAAAG